MKAYIKTHYEILAMNKEELAQVPPDVFMMYGTSLSSSLLGLFPKEKWNIFSYEQLMYMNQKVFNSLSSDVLHMLYQKFKNNSSLTIKKHIKDKTIEIVSEPLSLKILKSFDYQKKRTEKFNKVNENMKLLLEFNNKSDDYLIDVNIIHNVFNIEDKSPLKKYTENIQKRDLLDYLQSTCTQSIILDEIPDITTVQNICWKYNLEPFHRQYQKGLRYLSSRESNYKILGFQIGKTLYFKYDDIIEYIIQSK